MKKTKEIIWNQPISEFVGGGHPDIIADKISNIVRRHAITSATETIINRAGVYVSGETVFASKTEEKRAKLEIKALVAKLYSDYNQKGKTKVKFNFVPQDGMLADRKSKHLSGDQEVVYFHPLNKQDVHYHLREIDNVVEQYTSTYDYKVLVNMKNNTFNLSISTSHKEYENVKEIIINHARQFFGEKIKINICAFEGGSIFNDTGVTGRKLLVEKEGTGYPHGGGAYFGKDATKAAVYGYDLLQAKYGKRKSGTFVVTYFPGDKLDKPNYVGKA